MIREERKGPRAGIPVWENILVASFSLIMGLEAVESWNQFTGVTSLI